MLKSSDPFNQYVAFTRRFSNSKFQSSPQSKSNSFFALPAFANLDFGFTTLNTGSRFLDRGQQQWNPFSQRLLVHELGAPRWKAADDFSKAYTASIAISEGVHELFHILFWEPFLCGKAQVKTRAQFSELSFIFEAYCYWYGEIFTSRAQLRYPDGTSIFGADSSATSPHVHPMRIFAIEGISSPRKVLSIYLAGFRGYDSELNGFRSPSGRWLRDTIYGFYVSNSAAVVRHYNRLNQIGVFDRFATDFCKGAEQLAAYDVSEFSLDGLLEDPERVADIWPLLTRARKSKTAADLTKIRLRRRIQTRAYFLLTDLNLILERRLLDKNTLLPLSIEATRKFEGQVEAHLANLRSVWQELLANKNPRTISSKISSFDLQTIGLYQKLQKLKVATRYQIYPSDGLPEFVGLLPEKKIRAGELKLNLRTLRADYLKESNVTSAGLREVEKLELILKSKQSPQFKSRRYVRRHNAFVKRFLTLPSLQQNFKDEDFFENNFVYR